MDGRRLHLIGIGGAGMSGYARVAHALGAQVTGSDRSDSAYLEPLREVGIVPVIGHAAENVPAGDDVEVVVPRPSPPTTPSAPRRRSAGCASCPAASCSRSSAR